MPQDSMPDIRQLLGEIHRAVHFHVDQLKQMGVMSVPAGGSQSIAKTNTNMAKRRRPDELPASPGKRSEALTSVQKQEKLDALALQAELCRKCPISHERNKLVFGVGDPGAELVFVGEAPGMDEDRKGEPFVGRAGKLLDKIIAYMGLQRSQVYIMNTIKCHPPANRAPSPEELTHCRAFFDQQLAIIQPKVICALGAVATRALLNTEDAIGKLRGKWHEYQSIPVMPTYHPAYILRNDNEQTRGKVRSDMKLILQRLGRELPG